MSKGLKIGLGIGLIILIVVVLYFLFFKGSSSSGGSSAGVYKAYPGGDVYGNDVETDFSSMPLADAKKHADAIGAVAFLQNGNATYFKNKKTPITNTPGGNWTLYIKQ